MQQQAHARLDAARFAHLVTLFDSPEEEEANTARRQAVRMAKNAGLRLVDAWESDAVRLVVFKMLNPLGMKHPDQCATCRDMAAELEHRDAQLQALLNRSAQGRVIDLGMQIKAEQTRLRLRDTLFLLREVRMKVLKPLCKRLLLAWLKEKVVPVVCGTLALCIIAALGWGVYQAWQYLADKPAQVDAYDNPDVWGASPPGIPGASARPQTAGDNVIIRRKAPKRSTSDAPYKKPAFSYNPQPPQRP